MKKRTFSLEKDFQGIVRNDLKRLVDLNKIMGFTVKTSGRKGRHNDSSYPKDGWADIIVYCHQGMTAHIELKRNGGKQQGNQIEMEQACRRFGHKYYLIDNFDDWVSLSRKFGLG